MFQFFKPAADLIAGTGGPDLMGGSASATSGVGDISGSGGGGSITFGDVGIESGHIALVAGAGLLFFMVYKLTKKRKK